LAVKVQTKQYWLPANYSDIRLRIVPEGRLTAFPLPDIIRIFLFDRS